MLLNRIDFSSPANLRRTARKPGSEFSLDEAKEETGSARSINESAGALPLASLLALQGQKDTSVDYDEPQRQAHDILGVLEQMRLNILTGDTSTGQLRELAKMLAGFRIDQSEPTAPILREIKLLARVELAKRQA